MITVLVNGAQGRMGKTAVNAINEHANLRLAGECNHSDDLATKIAQTQPQVVLDFTNAAAVYENCKTIIATNTHPVIGSSGLLPDEVRQLQQECAAKKLGGIIAPNFCIGAILMMRFAHEAAKYYPQSEIIELHHDKKQDAPSGTAVKTAELIATVRDNIVPDDEELIPGARGAKLNNVPIHSVRLKGLLAHQEVLFGGEGELLSLRHDSFSREAYMPGVCLAIEKVVQLQHLVYGLEEII